MAVAEIIPELHCKSAKDVNVHTPASRIMFCKVGKAGGRFGDFAEVFEQVSLFTRRERAEKIQNINGNEQP